MKSLSALPVESLEARCLLSPLSKAGSSEAPAEISTARSVPRNGVPISAIVGLWTIRYEFTARAEQFDGTMVLTHGPDDKSYVAHFQVPGQFDCVLQNSAKFGQPTGFKGKAIDPETELKIVFKTKLNSFTNFSGTVKVGKQKGLISGNFVGSD